MDALEKIYTKFRNSNYKKTYKELERYLNLKETGVYDVLFDIYIICQIKLGMFDEAVKNMEILKKYFPNYYMNRPYELAWRYALCARGEKVQEILGNNNFTSEEYYKIAFNCYRNGNVAIARELFEKIIAMEPTEGYSKIREFSKKALEYISLYEEHKDTAFLKQSYAYFKYCGNELEPGHVIFANKFRDEFRENRENSDPKRTERPYMIWHIEDGIIYAFPITTNLNKNRHTFYTQDYAFQHPDRCLKDRIAVIRECDISNVEEKINSRDFEMAIKLMYRSVFISHRGIYQNDISYFMHKVAENKVANIGDVIIVPNINGTSSKYYFVLDIDNKNGLYKVVQVDNSFKPIGEYLQLGFMSIAEPIFEKITMNDVALRDGLLTTLKPSAFASNSMVGIIFEYGKRKLEILEETPDSYICIDVTNGYIPETVEIAFAPKNISIFNVEASSEELLKEQQRLFEEYKQNNMEEFITRSEEFQRTLKKKDN